MSKELIQQNKLKSKSTSSSPGLLPSTPIRKIEKPWGYELIWAQTKDYVAKILFVKAGESLSLQYHEIKEETLFLEMGDCRLEVGKKSNLLNPVSFVMGTAYHILPKMLHQISAITDCRIFEVSTPHLEDVIRLKDRYGRT